MNNENNEQKEQKEKVIVEKNRLYSFAQGVLHIVCLVVPVATAFAGYFCSSLLWKIFNTDKICPEWFKFIISLVFFAIFAAIIFVKSRNTNPVIRIRVSEKEKSE